MPQGDPLCGALVEGPPEKTVPALPCGHFHGNPTSLSIPTHVFFCADDWQFHLLGHRPHEDAVGVRFRAAQPVVEMKDGDSADGEGFPLVSEQVKQGDGIRASGNGDEHMVPTGNEAVPKDEISEAIGKRMLHAGSLWKVVPD